MDFFAQAYSNEQGQPSDGRRPTQPLYSPHPRYEGGTCQGYGSERNAHLRRASSGLEVGVPRVHQLSPSPLSGHNQPSHGSGYGYGYSTFAAHRKHHQNYDETQQPPLSPPGPKVTIFSNTVHHGKTDPLFSLGKCGCPAESSHEPDHSSVISPGMDHGNKYSDGSSTHGTSRPVQRRRATVSNPCLLHHINTDGSGVVHPPFMPQSLSSPSTPRYERRQPSFPVHPPALEERPES